MYFELFTGFRYLVNRQKHAFVSLITLLSMAGVAVGVMTLIVVIAVMTGAEYDLRKRILGAQPHVIVMHRQGLFGDWKTTADQIRQIPGVQSVAPFIHKRIVLRSASGMSGALLKGTAVEHAADARSTGFEDNVRPPAATPVDSIPSITLGKSLAEALDVEKGDTLLCMIFSNTFSFSVGHAPTMKRFVVGGIADSGHVEYDKTAAFIHIDDARSMFGSGTDEVTGIEVKLDRPLEADRIAQSIDSALAPAFWTISWMQMNRNIFSALKLQKSVMFIILILIIIVAAFNIAGSLFMMVMERIKDISILMAMGATAKQIRRIFMFKGLVIGFVGNVSGVSLGCVLCAILKRYQFIDLPGDVYYFTTLPVRLESMDMIAITLAAFAICFFASLYPARLASRIVPVDGLREI